MCGPEPGWTPDMRGPIKLFASQPLRRPAIVADGTMGPPCTRFEETTGSFLTGGAIGVPGAIDSRLPVPNGISFSLGS